MGFFGKLFKTKAHQSKDDKFKEIKLMIHLAKSDGKIEESEKVYLSDLISDLEDFTNSERTQLFSFMDSKSLPPLTKKDVTFSSSEKTNDVLEKLKELAFADGEFEQQEKDLIATIEALL